jgi:hypothetical protein
MSGPFDPFVQRVRVEILAAFSHEANAALAVLRNGLIRVLASADAREADDFANNEHDAFSRGLEALARRFGDAQNRISEAFDAFLSQSGVDAPSETSFFVRNTFEMLRDQTEKKGAALVAATRAREPLPAVDPCPVGSLGQTGDQYQNSFVTWIAPTQLQLGPPAFVGPAPARSSSPLLQLEEEAKKALCAPYIEQGNKLLAEYRNYGLWLHFSVFDVAEYAARVEIAESTFRAGYDALNRRFERTKVNLSRQLDKFQGEVPLYTSWLVREFPSQLADLLERKSRALYTSIRAHNVLSQSDASPLGTFSIFQGSDFTPRFCAGY